MEKAGPESGNYNKFKILDYLFNSPNDYKTPLQISEGTGVSISSVYRRLLNMERFLIKKYEIEEGKKEARYRIKKSVADLESMSRKSGGITAFSILLNDEGYKEIFGEIRDEDPLDQTG